MASLVELFDNTVQFQDFNGVPLAGGRLFVYALGRTRMMDSWSDINGLSLNPNPVIIDNVGQARVYVSPDFDYTIVVQDRYGKEIFSLDKYVMSGGDISHADVAVAPSETIGVSSYRAGDVTVYVPYLEADVGKVYSGIEPIIVNNDEDKISANTASFGVESPLYLSEDSTTATVVALNMSELEAALTGKADTTALNEVRDNMMSATAIGGVNNIITGYNGSAFSAGTTYQGIDPVHVDNENKTISVSSKELEAVAPLLITETDTAYQLSITANINSPRTRVIEYGTDRWEDVKSAMDDMSAGNIDYVVMKYTDGSGNEYYAPLDKYAPGAACNFVCPSNEQDTVYGYGQRRKDTIFTINSGDLWVTRNVRPFIGRVIGGTNVTVDVQGEDYVISANGIDASASEAIDLVTANSGDWNNVSAKLDTTAFSTVSGDFITALPDSANWNSTYTTVSDNSGSWGSLDPSASEAIDLVTANSGTWNTVTDKLDTTAFSTVSGDFVTALSDSANWNSTYNTVYSTSGTWNTVTDKLDTTAFSTVSGDFITALPASSNWDSTYNTVYNNSASWTGGGGKTYTGISPVVVDNTADTIAVNAKAVVVETPLTFNETSTAFMFGISGTDKWDSTYDTVHDNSASWTGGGGSTYTGDAQGALDEVYANSGNWNSTYNTVSTNSASWSGRPQVPVSGVNIDIYEADGKIVFSGMTGGGSTYTGDVQGALDEVYSKSADWNSAAGMNELPVSAGQGIDIQNVDGNIVFSCTGGSVPEGVLVESGLEYNAVNEISGYSGSAFAQYGAEKQWLVHDDTLVHAANSAQYALGVNLSAVAQLLGVDETVLWENSAGAHSFTTTEPLTNFKKIKFYINSHTAANIACVEYPMSGMNNEKISFGWFDYWTATANNGIWETAGFGVMTWHTRLNNTAMTSFSVSNTRYMGTKRNTDALDAGNYNDGAPFFYSVVGIGRRSNT